MLREMTMRRALFIGVLAALAFANVDTQPVWAQNPTTRPIAPAPKIFSPAEKAQLARISSYLNAMKSVEGRFLQVSASGASDQGTFYLKKPGRVRFEYQKPNPNLVIADGNTVAVENTALKTTDRFPLSNSPL